MPYYFLAVFCSHSQDHDSLDDISRIEKMIELVLAKSADCRFSGVIIVLCVLYCNSTTLLYAALLVNGHNSLSVMVMCD